MRQVPVPGTRRARSIVATAAIAAAALTAPAGANAHLVTAGETLSGIAAANGISTATLAAANGLDPESFVIAGHTLEVPGAAASTVSPVPATAGGHLIVPGETLSGIAAANGISTTTLAAANGLGPDSLVIAGTHLRVPAPTGTGGGAGNGGAPTASGGGHLVVPGETLSGIAAANGVTTQALASTNGVGPESFVIAGTRLQIPAAAQAPASSSAGPATTGVRVSADDIGQIAAQNGVSPSLAKAVAWQESGFNNSVLSSANARGVMQIIPSTWRFIQANLAGGTLDPQSSADNVRAGSLYLGHLLRHAGGDTTTAIAGYYQGLASVRRIGLLPETQRYVANVLALRSRFGG